MIDYIPKDMIELVKTHPNLVVDIEDFTLDKSIGKGGAAEVFKAYDNKIKIECAVKQLYREELSKVSMDHLIREIHTMATCNNRFCIPITGFTPLPPYSIVLEYLSNGSLDDAIFKRAAKPISETHMNIIAICIASGMAHIHSKGIMHRDLKPGNVLLDFRNLPRICDFGLARIDDQKKITRGIGTPTYMPPEQISGKTYTRKVDIYAYGVMLYEMVERTRGFSGFSSKSELVNAILNNNLRPTFTKKTSSAMQKLITKCWDKDPAKRPEFTEIFDELASGKAKFADADMKKIKNVVNQIRGNEKKAEVAREMPKMRVNVDKILAMMEPKQKVVPKEKPKKGVQDLGFGDDSESDSDDIMRPQIKLISDDNVEPTPVPLDQIKDVDFIDKEEEIVIDDTVGINPDYNNVVNPFFKGAGSQSQYRPKASVKPIIGASSGFHAASRGKHEGINQQSFTQKRQQSFIMNSLSNPSSVVAPLPGTSAAPVPFQGPPGGTPQFQGPPGGMPGGPPPFKVPPGGIPPFPSQSGGPPPFQVPPGGIPPFPAQPGGVTPFPSQSGGPPPFQAPPGGPPPFQAPPGGIPPFPGQSSAPTPFPGPPGGIPPFPGQSSTPTPFPGPPGGIPPFPGQSSAPTPFPGPPGGMPFQPSGGFPPRNNAAPQASPGSNGISQFPSPPGSNNSHNSFNAPPGSNNSEGSSSHGSGAPVPFDSFQTQQSPYKPTSAYSPTSFTQAGLTLPQKPGTSQSPPTSQPTSLSGNKEHPCPDVVLSKEESPPPSLPPMPPSTPAFISGNSYQEGQPNQFPQGFIQLPIDSAPLSNPNSPSFVVTVEQLAQSVTSNDFQAAAQVLSPYTSRTTPPAAQHAVLRAMFKLAVRDKSFIDHLNRSGAFRGMPFGNADCEIAASDLLAVVFQRRPQIVDSSFFPQIVYLAKSRPLDVTLLLKFLIQSYSQLDPSIPYFILSVTSILANTKAAPRAVSLISQLLSHPPFFNQYHQEALQQVVAFSQTKDPKTARMAYITLANNYEDSIQFDFAMMLYHLNYPTVSDSVLSLMLRIRELPPALVVTNALIAAAKESPKAGLVLQKYADTSINQANILLYDNGWSSTGLPTLVDTLKLLLILFKYKPMRPALSSTEWYPNVIKTLISSQNPFILVAIVSILRRSDLNAQKISILAQKDVFKDYYRTCLSTNDISVVQNAMVLTDTISRIYYVPDVKLMIPKVLSLVSSQDQQLSAYAYQNLAVLSTIEDSARCLKDQGADKYFEQDRSEVGQIIANNLRNL